MTVVIATSTAVVLTSVVSSSIDRLLTTQLPTILSQLNNPSLVGSLGILLAILLPIIDNKITSIPSDQINLIVVKVLNLLAYTINFIATSQPGRLDGTQQRDEISLATTTKKKTNGKVTKTKTTTTTMTKNTSSSSSLNFYEVTMRDRSLINPSGWAFIIWAPIFLGELVLTTVGAVIPNDKGSVGAQALQTSTTGFIFSQIFQSLWSASFRPKYFRSTSKTTTITTIVEPFISAFMLGMIAHSLKIAHGALSKLQLSSFQYILYNLPISLHFGWTTAATLVNINGNIASLYSNNKEIVAYSGYISVVIATAVGVGITISRTAPVYGFVIAWALAACSTGLDQRIIKLKQKPDLVIETGYYGAIIQQWLCRIGSVISALTAIIIIIVSIILPKFNKETPVPIPAPIPPPTLSSYYTYFTGKEWL